MIQTLLKTVKLSYQTEQGQWILNQVDLALNQGEIIAILGRSGTGKSTLLRLLAGLIQPTQGAVYYQGDQVQQPLNSAKMVFQYDALLPWLTVEENIALGLRSQKLPPNDIEHKVKEALQMIDLAHYQYHYPPTLSGGMRQKVAFARAFVTEPEILLLDEPFASLDAVTSEQLQQQFLSLWQEGTLNVQGTILITHDVQQALRFADRVLILAKSPGEMVAAYDLKHKGPERLYSPKSAIEQTLMAAL